MIEIARSNIELPNFINMHCLVLLKITGKWIALLFHLLKSIMINLKLLNKVLALLSNQPNAKEKESKGSCKILEIGGLFYDLSFLESVDRTQKTKA